MLGENIEENISDNEKLTSTTKAFGRKYLRFCDFAIKARGNVESERNIWSFREDIRGEINER